MNQKSFFERVNQKVNTAPTTVPLDLALLGIPLEEAACIDINRAVRAIAPTESTSTELSFSDLTAARPPIPNDNLFIQFETAAAAINSDFPGWVGVHIVPFNIARFSRLFLMLDDIPERIHEWPEAYAMVIYREWPGEISLAPAGMLLGLDDEGKVMDAAMFGITAGDDGQPEAAWEHAAHLTAWITYLTFCVFTMVNQRETPIRRAAPGLWNI